MHKNAEGREYWGEGGGAPRFAWLGAPFLCCVASRVALRCAAARVDVLAGGNVPALPRTAHRHPAPPGIFRQLSPPHMCRPFPLVFFCFGATRLASILLLLLLPPLRLLLLSLNILPSLALLHGVR